MDFLDAVRTNLLSPAVLFFGLGVLAAVLNTLRSRACLRFFC
jgi:hypothetical protein